MPELPEVETVRRGLAPVMEGARIESVTLNRPDLRFPFPDGLQARLNGATIKSLGRRSKYLQMWTDREDVLIAHLGMSGSFRIERSGVDTPGAFHHERSKNAVHDHVSLDLMCADGTAAKVIYNDPRRFGFMDLARADTLEDNRFIKDLGVEPTGNELNGDLLAQLLEGRRTPLKAALLDQKLIAGLGNIYVCEALWRARISPKRQARTLVRQNGKPTPRCTKLAQAIRDVIADAIRAGGSSLRDYVHTDGSLGYFQHSFAAYDREGKDCRHDACGGTISRIVQSGRSTFFCGTCQR
ncbi:MAG: bifunctional DNA-formamidopyrimidine glycosylase/DNA-(apurinic or apyrimidinic site) lyase [Pseudomonadota bacterium]